MANPTSSPTAPPATRLHRMVGRDVGQAHRAATPLELLFDLTFVVAFGLAADQTAHLLAEGHLWPAILGFGFAMFAVVWAWINFTWLAITVFLDVGGVVIAERRTGGTPWHPHHIAERYGLLVIIALGEVILGMIASVSAVIEMQDWSSETILLIVAGLALTFGMWWVYFIVPSGAVLAAHRERSFGWGYSHVLIFAAIAATGSGLHVAAYVLEGEAHISTQAALLTVVIPEFVFLVALFATYAALVRDLDVFSLALLGVALLVLAAAVLLAGAGVGFDISLLVACLAPAVIVVGHETRGHRHQAVVLARLG